MVSRERKSSEFGGFVEVRNREVRSTDAAKITRKGTIIGVISTKTISEKAKNILEENDIAYAENVKVKEKEKERERRK